LALAVTAFGQNTGSVHEAGSGHDLEPGFEPGLGHILDPGLDLVSDMDNGLKSAWVDVLDPVSVMGKLPLSSLGLDLGSSHGLTTVLEHPIFLSVMNAPTPSGSVPFMPDKSVGGFAVVR
jgi:hypothetical protein